MRALEKTIAQERSEGWQVEYDQARSDYEDLREEMIERGVDFEQHEKLLQRRAQVEREVASLRSMGEQRNEIESKIRKTRLRLVETHEARLAARRDQAQSLEVMDADDGDGEDAFQAPHPGHGGKGLIRLFVARFAFWHDGLAMLAIRREHAVEPGEVQSRTRDQRRQAGDEVEWVEDDVGGAVAKRLLEPMDDLSPIVGREPLVGDGGPCDVATELFELVALGGFTDGGGVERKARLPGEQGGWEGFGLYRDGAQGQCLPVGASANTRLAGHSSNFGYN